MKMLVSVMILMSTVPSQGDLPRVVEKAQAPTAPVQVPVEVQPRPGQICPDLPVSQRYTLPDWDMTTLDGPFARRRPLIQVLRFDGTQGKVRPAPFERALYECVRPNLPRR